MNFKDPIDITAVLTAAQKHKDLLKSIDRMDANEVLQHFTPMPGITDSIELGKVEGGSISSKYQGVFLGDKKLGAIVPRRLIVRPVVMEMSDEPERYRRTYIAEVPGENRSEHPFELWILNYGHALASEDLHNAIFVARYSTGVDDNDITDAFDGIGTILEMERTAGNISVSNGNMFQTGDLTRANVGEVLKNMYRKMPLTFKRKASKMFISASLGEMYDDWRKDEGQIILGQTEETTGTKFLIGSNGKCELVRLSILPEGSQFVLLTTKPNVVYGYHKEGDFKSMRPFNSGNPYKFTAAGKYVIGFQAVSLHKSELCINEKPLDPSKAATLGTLKVTIAPEASLSLGASWRVKGEAEWRKSGDIAYLSVGAKEIEYSDVVGYTKPTGVALSATITAGQKTEKSVTYVAS